MALEKGYICLARSLTKCAMYKDTLTSFLYIHLLLSANYDEQKYLDTFIVSRGQIVRSLRTLSDETGMSVNSVRKCLAKLKKHGLVKTQYLGYKGKYGTLIILPKYEQHAAANYDHNERPP